MQPAARALALASLASLIASGCAVEETGQGAHEEVGEAESEAVICADGEVVRGIDVSYYQGQPDWNAVANAGANYGFAITRINDGSFMDPEFDTNWAAIKEAGLIRGAYQFFHPGNDVSNQAQVVIDKVGKLGPGDLPVVIDVEDTDGLPPAQIAQAVGEWIMLVEEGTGKKPIIYVGKYFWQDNVGSGAYADYPLWHAAYPNACQPPNPPPPDCGCPNIADQWDDWLIWQYTSSGSVPGISGNVDLNVFNGSMDDLIAFASAGSMTYGGSLVSIDAPTTVLPGETFVARVTMLNSGPSPWNELTKLGTTEPRDGESPFHHASWPAENRAAVVAGVVDPGLEYTFEFSLQAPEETDVYTLHFGMLQEGVAWFADQGGPPDDAVRIVVQVSDASTGSGSGPGTTGSGGGSTGEGGGDGEGEGVLEGAACEVRSLVGSTGGRGWTAIAGTALAIALFRRRRR